MPKPARRPARRNNSLLRELGWTALVACVAVAIWQGLPHGIRPLYDNLQHRSNHVGTVIRRETNSHGLTSPTPAPTTHPARRPR